MISYYKKTLLILFQKIKVIENDPYNSQPIIYDVQNILIKKLKYIEKKIKGLKTSAKSSNNESHEDVFLGKLQKYRELLYLFKNIGDSLAYLFIDRQDFKPLSLNNSPGFITGKAGFNEEYKILRKISKIGAPCVMADLTNELRHGDVYVFVKDFEPLIIEVKSSKTKNPRSKRQKKKLEKLQYYLQNDAIKDFHGKGIKAIRVEYGNNPIYHLEKLDEMISQAMRNGFSERLIEPGLQYIVTTVELDAQFEKIINRFKTPLVHFLNSTKLDRKPYPYFPIILSIGDPKALLDFFLGGLCIFVAIDMSVVVNELEKRGYETEFLQDDDEFILSINSDEYKSLGMDEAMRVSYGFFGKVIFEFVSLSWMIDCTAERPEKFIKMMKLKNL